MPLCVYLEGATPYTDFQFAIQQAFRHSSAELHGILVVVVLQTWECFSTNLAAVFQLWVQFRTLSGHLCLLSVSQNHKLHPWKWCHSPVRWAMDIKSCWHRHVRVHVFEMLKAEIDHFNPHISSWHYSGLYTPQYLYPPEIICIESSLRILKLQCIRVVGAFLCPFSDLQTTRMVLLPTRLPVHLTVIQEGMWPKLEGTRPKLEEEVAGVEVILVVEGMGYQVRHLVAMWNEHVRKHVPSDCYLVIWGSMFLYELWLVNLLDFTYSYQVNPFDITNITHMGLEIKA